MAARKTAILSIRIVANSERATAGLKKTARNVAGLQRDLNRLKATGFNKLTGSLGKVAAMGALVAGAAAGATAGIGALAAAAVAASIAIGPALAAIMLGFEGIKNAAKQIQPQFDALKTAVSGVFERELAPGMAMLGDLMDTLTGSMMNLASTISTEFNLMMGLLDQSAGKMQTLIQGSGEFVTGFGIGMRDLVQGLIDFGAAAQPAMAAFGESLGKVVGVVGEVLTKFSEMGKVPALMAGVSAVFDGFADLLGSVLTVVLDLVTAVGPSLGSAFSAIGGALESMAPALAEFGEQFGTVLVEAVNQLLPVLPKILDGFSRVLDILVVLLPVIAPLAGFIAENIDVFIVLAATLKIVAVAVAILNLALMVGPWGLVVIAVIALVAALYWVATRTQFFQTVWETVVSALGVAWNWFVELLKSIWNGVVVWFTTSLEYWKSVWNGFTAFLSAGWEIVRTAAIAVWNGISAVIQGAIAVATTVINGFKAAATAVWNGIKSVASAVWEGIKSVISGAMDHASNMMDRFKSVGTSAFNVVKSAVGGVKSAIDWLVGAIQNVISWLGRIRFPSPPGWMSSLMGGFGAAEFTFQPASAMRFVPESYQMFTAPGPELSAAASFAPIGARFGGGGGGDTNVTNVNITVEGAVDPVGTANQIRKILNNTDQRVGVSTTATWG